MRAQLPQTEGTVDNNGHEIHYEIYGGGDHTILFVPTWSLVHSRVYKAQVPYFSGRFRCITYDPRGNGKSGRSVDPEAYSLKTYVGDALAVMDATDTDKVILFGYSLSGRVCALLAAHHSERIEAVITIVRCGAKLRRAVRSQPTLAARSLRCGAKLCRVVRSQLTLAAGSSIGARRFRGRPSERVRCGSLGVARCLRACP